MAGQPWDESYRHAPAPWDIGRPQPAIARLAAEGGFAGRVLDAGCGTGENALLVASLGLPVLGAAFTPGAPGGGADGWEVVAISPDALETRFHDHGAPAWLATIKRL